MSPSSGRGRQNFSRADFGGRIRDRWIEQLFEIVKDQQGGKLQSLDNLIQSTHPRQPWYMQGLQDRSRDPARIGQIGKGHKPDSATKWDGQASRGLHRETGFAGTSRAGQGHQARLGIQRELLP